MDTLKDFLWPIIAIGGLGAFIDFYIGKAGQKRVTDWLETWWLRLSDVRWGNFGREEALFAVQVIDRLFGKRLFSIRRLVVVLLTSLVAGGIHIALVLSTLTKFPGWGYERPLDIVINTLWLLAILFLCAFSLSATRFAAMRVSVILTKLPYLNFLGLGFLLLFQYMLFAYWVRFSITVFVCSFFFAPLRSRQEQNAAQTKRRALPLPRAPR
jgi:hypothetical protein